MVILRIPHRMSDLGEGRAARGRIWRESENVFDYFVESMYYFIKIL